MTQIEVTICKSPEEKQKGKSGELKAISIKMLCNKTPQNPVTFTINMYSHTYESID